MNDARHGAPPPPEPGMTEERLAEIRNKPMYWEAAIIVTELLDEIARLRSSTGADERLREAAMRALLTARQAVRKARKEGRNDVGLVLSVDQAERLCDFLRASLSVVPATGETSDG